METKDIGTKIKKLREKKGLSRNELANLSGISPTYVYQLEQGLKSPTISYLEYLCGGLGVTLEQFFITDEKLDDELSLLTADQKSIINQFIKSLKQK